MADVTGHKTGGREAGTRNRRTEALLALAEAGETPCGFALRIMRDADQPIDIRLHGARIAAPYIHPKPYPLAETVTLDLPDTSTPEGVKKASAEILRAVANAEVPVSTGRDVMAIVDGHRRNIELIDIVARLEALETARRK